MNHFRPIDRKTDYLLPPSLDDWLPEDHLARFILEAIERLDLSALTWLYGDADCFVFAIDAPLMNSSPTGCWAAEKRIAGRCLLFQFALPVTGAVPSC